MQKDLSRFISRFANSGAVVLIIFSFILDVLTPIGIASWVLYIPPLLLLSYSMRVRVLYGFSAAISALIIVGDALSPPSGLPFSFNLINDSIAIAVVWGCTAILINRKRLVAKLRHLAQIVESSEDAVISKTLDGTILTWNPGAEKMYGYTEEEVRGKPISLLSPPDRHDEIPSILERLKRGERVSHFETERMRKDGAVLPISLTISPVRNDHGGIIAASVIARDITERNKKENEILDLNGRLQVSNKELENLGYSLSHDLRAPLQRILGFGELLLLEYEKKLDQTGRDYLRFISDNCLRMSDMISGLLNISRITREKVNLEEVDLSAMAHAVERDLRAAEPARDAEFVIEDGMSAKGDPRLLRNVLDNLIGNAWKFTAKRSSGARIEFGRTEHDGKRSFFVRDNGAGFDMQHNKKLFTIFQRLHSPKEFDGNGIGLATAQRIIRSHGGEIWAEGKVNEGATFYFIIGKDASVLSSAA